MQTLEIYILYHILMSKHQNNDKVINQPLHHHQFVSFVSFDTITQVTNLRVAQMRFSGNGEQARYGYESNILLP